MCIPYGVIRGNQACRTDTPFSDYGGKQLVGGPVVYVSAVDEEHFAVALIGTNRVQILGIDVVNVQHSGIGVCAR